MKRIFALAAAIALSGSMAFAAITAEDVVKTYQDAGYVRIEVETGLTQIKVEAYKDGAKIEVIYDKETGAELKSESFALDPSVVVTPGVEMKTDDGDFLDGEDDGEDELDDGLEDESEDELDDSDEDENESESESESESENEGDNDND